MVQPSPHYLLVPLLTPMGGSAFPSLYLLFPLLTLMGGSAFPSLYCRQSLRVSLDSFRSGSALPSPHYLLVPLLTPMGGSAFPSLLIGSACARPHGTYRFCCACPFGSYRVDYRVPRTHHLLYLLPFISLEGLLPVTIGQSRAFSYCKGGVMCVCLPDWLRGA